MPRFGFTCLLLLPALMIGTVCADAPADQKPFAADQAYLKEHYTKYEYEIEMRDGVKLSRHTFPRTHRGAIRSY